MQFLFWAAGLGSPRMLSTWGNACSRGLRPQKDSQQLTENSGQKVDTNPPQKAISEFLRRGNDIFWVFALFYLATQLNRRAGERVSLELGKKAPSHNLHILSTQPLARAGIWEGRQPSSPEGSLPATLAIEKLNTGHSCLKFNPKREGFQVATQSTLHVASLDLGFSFKVPMQIFLECWL